MHRFATASAAALACSCTPLIASETTLSRSGATDVRVRFVPPPGWLEAFHGQAVITGVLDGYEQRLDAQELSEWSMHSAFFNGDALRVRFEPEGSGEGVALSLVPTVPGPREAERSLCDVVDTRTPVGDDPRLARLAPSLCTAFLIGEREMISAGHCFVVPPGSPMVAQFGCPPLTASGRVIHPEPSMQHPVDPASLVFSGGARGEDWAVLGVYDSDGLSPLRRAGARFSIAPDASALPAEGTVRIVGFGRLGPVSSAAAINESFGPLITTGLITGYRADTVSGHSGAPVIDTRTGRVVALHTHGGCFDFGLNTGTPMDHPGLRAAMDAPTGVRDPGERIDTAEPIGLVDAADLSRFVEAWLRAEPGADLTAANANPGEPDRGRADGRVDGADLSFFVEAWIERAR